MSVPSSGADASSGGVGTSQLGRYELVCEVAKAQAGALWAGAAEGEPVFVRRVGLGTPLSAALNEHLTDAARWAASARLPGFAPVLDVVATSEEIGVVSEYREGECLRALLRQASFKRTPLPLGVALRIAVDVIDALEAAEGLERITPASLWPDSVLVGSDGITTLLDLGVASVIAGDPSWSAHPELASYSAPEKLENPVSASTRSDVFVVGILLWEMIANQRLFTGLSAPAARQKVLTAPVSRLDASKLGAPADPDLADIVERALDRNPAVRFFDVTELRAAIESGFGDAIAAPEEVAAALAQISGSLIGIRKRALDKALSAGAVAAPIPAETAQKLRGVPANATLLGVAPLASGSAPTPSNPIASSAPQRPAPPMRSGTLLGMPIPDEQEAALLARRPPPPPAPRPPPARTGALADDFGGGALAPLHGLEPDDEQEVDDLLEGVKRLPKLTPPPTRSMSTTAPLGSLSDSRAPDSVDALIESAKSSRPAPPLPPPTSMAQTAPLGTDVAVQYGFPGVPAAQAPSSFPARDSGPMPPSDPPPAARPLALALQRNRKIVVGVVAAMALLLTVAIVIGAVRSRSAAKEDAAEANRAKAKTTGKRPDKPEAKTAAAAPAQARSTPDKPKKGAAATASDETKATKEEGSKASEAATLAAAPKPKARALANGAKPIGLKSKAAPKKPVAKAKPAKAKAKPAKAKAKPAKAAKAPAKKKPAAKPGKKVAAKKVAARKPN